MAINPTRAEAHLSKTMQALTAINNGTAKLKAWAEEQDQRQVQVTLLENQISDLKSKIIPTANDAPPNEENAKLQGEIDALETEKSQIGVMYGEVSTLVNKAAQEIEALRQQYPNIEQQAAAQQAALARKQAAFPRLLIRHLYKCKRHGWDDPRMPKLAEHRARIKAERREMEAKLEASEAMETAQVEG